MLILSILIVNWWIWIKKLHLWYFITFGVAYCGLNETFDKDVTIVLALNRISTLIDIFFEKCFMLSILWVLVFYWAKFHKNVCQEFRGIFEFLQKGYKLCILMQTNLQLFGCFLKVFIAHSFCKWPLYTTDNRLNAIRLAQWKKKTCESVKRNAELSLQFLRLLSRNQRLNQN